MCVCVAKKYVITFFFRDLLLYHPKKEEENEVKICFIGILLKRSGNKKV